MPCRIVRGPREQVPGGKAEWQRRPQEVLATYGARIDDPRRAWIELDLLCAITRENPIEAKRIFARRESPHPANLAVLETDPGASKSYE